MKIARYIFLLVWISVLTPGCIREDLSGCTSEFNLNIVAVNATGEDITETGEAGTVEVFVFDFNREFTENAVLPPAAVQRHIPYKYLYQHTADLWFVGWSNLNGAQDVTLPVEGSPKEDALIRLRRDGDGYAISPDDLFFGLKPFNINPRITSADLVIARKTALMYLTVIGLNPSFGNRYTFIVSGAEDDTFDFAGNLRGSPVDYRQRGEFDTSNGSFHTFSAFRVFPLRAGVGFTISIYRDGLLIAAVDADQDGNPIVPRVGETINVLIDLAAQLSVNVRVTDWDKTFQWLQW